MVDITVASDFFGRRRGAREGFGRAVGRNEESIRKCYVRTDENNFLLFLIGAEGPPYTDRRGRVYVLYQI